ncbi:MAG: hypothetical protein ACOC90_05695, partial [Bacteroidota bacterium]
MKKSNIQRNFIITVGFILIVSIVGMQSFSRKKNKKSGGIMELYSTAFKNEEFIPVKYSCKGE